MLEDEARIEGMMKGKKQTNWNSANTFGNNPPNKSTDGQKNDDGSKSTKPGKFIPNTKFNKEGKRGIRKNEKCWVVTYL